MAKWRFSSRCSRLRSLGSMVFFAGQTAAAEWAAPRCDELSSPVHALMGVCAVICLAVTDSAAHVGNLALRVTLDETDAVLVKLAQVKRGAT